MDIMNSLSTTIGHIDRHRGVVFWGIYGFVCYNNEDLGDFQIRDIP